MSLITDPYERKPGKVILPSSFSQTGGFNSYEADPMKFRDRVRSNDPVMVPDRGFTKQLKKLSPTLEVMWDWTYVNPQKERCGCWAIWEFPPGQEPYQVMRILDPKKSYRELGQDILIQLLQCLGNRFETSKVIDYIEEHNNQIRRRKMKDFKAKIEAATLESFNYVRGVLQVQVPRSANLQEALK